jgi:hypothetical protein
MMGPAVNGNDDQTKWRRQTIARIFADGRDVSPLMVTSLEVTAIIVAERRPEPALSQTRSGFTTICADGKGVKSEDAWLSIGCYAAQKLTYRA